MKQSLPVILSSFASSLREEDETTIKPDEEIRMTLRLPNKDLDSHIKFLTQYLNSKPEDTERTVKTGRDPRNKTPEAIATVRQRSREEKIRIVTDYANELKQVVAERKRRGDTDVPSPFLLPPAKGNK